MKFIKIYEKFNNSYQSGSLELVDKIQKLPDLPDDIYDMLVDVESQIGSEMKEYDEQIKELEKKFDELEKIHDPLVDANDECEKYNKKIRIVLQDAENRANSAEQINMVYLEPEKAFKDSNKIADRELIMEVFASFLHLLETHPLEMGGEINKLGKYDREIFGKMINKEHLDAIIGGGGNIIRRLE